ncbi:MAG: OmpA family protein [Alphaproteobacteria bacterium]|nr:OmpA family protein [Alphaproteobacteria bacterium]
MKLIKSLGMSLASVAVLALGACSTHDVDVLRQTDPVGTQFTKDLSQEYLYQSEVDVDDHDFSQASIMARKGLQASGGELVFVEDIGSWPEIPAESIQELAEGRDALLYAFEAGATQRDTTLAAEAQVNFDCWLVAEAHRCTKKSNDCHSEFDRVMEELEHGPSVSIDEELFFAGEGVPEAYLVFFDLNSHKIDAGGLAVVENAAKVISEGDVREVTILGYTDLTGPQAYDQKLSGEGANSAENALRHFLGDDANSVRITSVGQGEKDPIVKTTKANRENRRSVILFR